MRPVKGMTDDQRLSIIEEHLAGASKNSLILKYNLSSTQVIKKWMISFGILNPQHPTVMETKDENEEILHLQQELKELKTTLAYERMRADAYDTMISIAEKELRISIRKKSGTKQ